MPTCWIVDAIAQIGTRRCAARASVDHRWRPVDRGHAVAGRRQMLVVGAGTAAEIEDRAPRGTCAPTAASTRRAHSRTGSGFSVFGSAIDSRRATPSKAGAVVVEPARASSFTATARSATPVFIEHTQRSHTGLLRHRQRLAGTPRRLPLDDRSRAARGGRCRPVHGKSTAAPRRRPRPRPTCTARCTAPAGNGGQSGERRVVLRQPAQLVRRLRDEPATRNRRAQLGDRPLDDVGELVDLVGVERQRSASARRLAAEGASTTRRRQERDAVERHRPARGR